MSKPETAYHEAGHAVVAHAQGLGFESVSIVEDEDSLGRCHVTLPEGFQPDERREGSVEILEAHLAVCLAGALAQELFTGESVELAANDLSGALKLVGSLGASSEQMNARIEEAEQRARGILHRGWPAVEALAARLLEQEELDSERTAAVIREGLREVEEER